ncbi:hypothetical protein N7488_004631 [Penicillium malachiteum]|nr:hypothetical protein N7488_004631 [Penicillium malachiteum]
MLLRKQTGFSGEWKVKLQFQPTNSGHEAGAAIWWSQFAHASIGLRKPFDGRNSGLEMIARCYDETEDQFKEYTQQLSLEHNSVQIIIRAHPTRYELCFSVLDNEQVSDDLIKLGEISSRALTQRRSGKESPNTGSHFAIYAQGAYDKPCLESAHFDFAEWTEFPARD